MRRGKEESRRTPKKLKDLQPQLEKVENNFRLQVKKTYEEEFSTSAKKLEERRIRVFQEKINPKQYLSRKFTGHVAIYTSDKKVFSLPKALLRHRFAGAIIPYLLPETNKLLYSKKARALRLEALKVAFGEGFSLPDQIVKDILSMERSLNDTRIVEVDFTSKEVSLLADYVYNTKWFNFQKLSFDELLTLYRLSDFLVLPLKESCEIILCRRSIYDRTNLFKELIAGCQNYPPRDPAILFFIERMAFFTSRRFQRMIDLTHQKESFLKLFSQGQDPYHMYALGLGFENGLINGNALAAFSDALTLFYKNNELPPTSLLFHLGYFEITSKTKIEEGLKKIVFAAQEGYGPAEGFLGHLYSEGLKTLKGEELLAKNSNLAISWFQKSASHEFPGGFLAMGDYFNDAAQSIDDEKQALTYYEKASINGIGDADYHIGFFYAQGKAGVAQYLARAREIWENAEGKGSIKAMHHLADCYGYGAWGFIHSASLSEMYRTKAKKAEKESAT